MRDEKEERKKQARSNKQTRQSNTAHPRHMYMSALGVLCCFALFVCLTLLASFFLPSHLSFKNMYMYNIYTLSGGILICTVLLGVQYMWD